MYNKISNILNVNDLLKSLQHVTKVYLEQTVSKILEVDIELFENYCNCEFQLVSEDHIENYELFNFILSDSDINKNNKLRLNVSIELIRDIDVINVKTDFHLYYKVLGNNSVDFKSSNIINFLPKLYQDIDDANLRKKIYWDYINNINNHFQHFVATNINIVLIKNNNNFKYL